MIQIPEGYEKVCKVSELKEGIGKQIFIDDFEIAIFKFNDEIYALSNICPHQKTHLIHEGYIENDKVVCPVHGWMFDLRTGNIAEGRRGLQTYNVLIHKNEVFVKTYKKELDW